MSTCLLHLCLSTYTSVKLQYLFLSALGHFLHLNVANLPQLLMYLLTNIITLSSNNLLQVPLNTVNLLCEKQVKGRGLYLAETLSPHLICKCQSKFFCSSKWHILLFSAFSQPLQLYPTSLTCCQSLEIMTFPHQRNVAALRKDDDNRINFRLKKDTDDSDLSINRLSEASLHTATFI